MRLETFFEKFELFANAPNEVEKIRELVLRLAFSGGLTYKSPPRDGVPDGWETRTIKSISASISSGFACSRSHQVEGGHVHLRTHNISTLGKLNFDLLVRIDPKMVDPQKSSIQAGDILFNNTNSQELVGKTSLVDRDYDYGFSNHITRIRLKDGIFPGFVVFYLSLLRNSGYFARICTRWINQAAVNNVTLKEQTIPLPPLAEQKRIVAKVDELMALWDRLEAQQQERETRHASLARASLARFADAPTPANLDYLFHPSYTIVPADLRKSILTLAVQGKLARSVERKPVVLSEVIELISGQHLLANEHNEEGKGIPYLTGPSDFGPKHPVPTRWTDTPKVVAEPGDILVTVKGSGVGKTNKLVSEQTAISRQLMAVRVTGADPDFVHLVLMNAADHFQESMTGIAIPGIGRKDVLELEVGLPPLAEQRRIVAKVDRLMALVDELEDQLATAKEKGTSLLDAVIHELLNPSAEIIEFPRIAQPQTPDRAAIGCYAIQRMAAKPYFGRTAEMKVLYLAETHLGLALGGQYFRDAAGPFDQWIYRFEEEAERQGWFKSIETSMKVEYRKGAKLAAKAGEAEAILPIEVRKEFDRLLGLIEGRPTEEVEIIATLFAVWNDFLIDARAPSDDDILNEVLENWHPKKKRFSRPRLKQCLDWLRANNLTPNGRGPRTQRQASLLAQ
jgi:type I restriction enzyme, S subunit